MGVTPDLTAGEYKTYKAGWPITGCQESVCWQSSSLAPTSPLTSPKPHSQPSTKNRATAHNKEREVNTNMERYTHNTKSAQHQNKKCKALKPEPKSKSRVERRAKPDTKTHQPN